MRTTIISILCGAVIGTALSGPAIAGEQLVMPFACRVAGGQILLAPSEPRTYQIYGQRAHKRLTTCSPYDPRRCHTWSVHRFDLDCGGVRTSWPAVVAALSPILADSIGYGRPGGPHPAPPRPHRGPGASAFPGGFAPNPMRVARFEHVNLAPAVDLAPVNVPIPLKKPAPAEPTVEVAQTAPNVEPVAEPPSLPDEVETPPASAPAEDNDADKATVLAQQRALQVEAGPADSDVTGALPKPKTSSLFRDAGLVFVFTVAALLALSAALLLRQRGLALLPARIPLLLRGPNTLPALRRDAVAEHESPQAHEQHETIEAPAVHLRLWDKDWLPKTKAEALNVLGVDPAASADKIKSTVTRLRRALHPDHAFDDEDRDLRERRLKQINVAWEIVSEKRRAPWLAVKPQSSWPLWRT